VVKVRRRCGATRSTTRHPGRKWSWWWRPDCELLSFSINLNQQHFVSILLISILIVYVIIVVVFHPERKSPPAAAGAT
jgi:hypothetical protein